MAQRLDKRMRSKIFPCVSLLVGWSGGPPPGEILKTKNVGEAISGHFAMRLKSQIYQNYAYLCFRGESPHLFRAFRPGALARSYART